MAYAMTIFGCLTQKLELVNIKKLCKTSALLIIAISQRTYNIFRLDAGRGETTAYSRHTVGS